ncbi:MAG: hypothetical protein ACHQPI_00215 [Thermoanaerobaculia bacterium]
MNLESGRTPRSLRSKVLLVLTSIYGLLYLVFILGGGYGTAGSEPVVVKLLFLLFLVGYAVVWLDERVGGAVFVLWWAGMWYLGLFVARTDRGAGVVMGVPLFVLGIIFIVSWYRRRGARQPGS